MKNKRERNIQQMSFSVSVSADRIPGTGFLLDLSQRSQGKVLKISLRCICPSVRPSVVKDVSLSAYRSSEHLYREKTFS